MVWLGNEWIKKVKMKTITGVYYYGELECHDKHQLMITKYEEQFKKWKQNWELLNDFHVWCSGVGWTISLNSCDCTLYDLSRTSCSKSHLWYSHKCNRSDKCWQISFNSSEISILIATWKMFKHYMNLIRFILRQCIHFCKLLRIIMMTLPISN